MTKYYYLCIQNLWSPCIYLWFPNQSQAKKSFLSWIWFSDCGLSMEHLNLASSRAFTHNVLTSPPLAFPSLEVVSPSILNSQSRNLGVTLRSSQLSESCTRVAAPSSLLLFPADHQFSLFYSQILFKASPTLVHLHWYHLDLSTYHFFFAIF